MRDDIDKDVERDAMDVGMGMAIGGGMDMVRDDMVRDDVARD